MFQSELLPIKVVSFDVGIKNMAFCVFQTSNSSTNLDDIEIIDWNVIDLIDAPPPTNKICQSTLKNKKICGKKAKFESSEPSNCFCDKHAKTSNYLMPTRERSPKSIKKLKIGELQELVLKENIPNIILSDKRPVIIDKIITYYSANCLVPIVCTKKKADDCSIISIGQRIKQSFNSIQSLQNVTHVLIENQISTIASRMSIIQGLLTQYFIMRHTDEFNLVLEFISSKNKLKHFDEKIIPTKTTTVSQKYRQHKSDSILYAKQLIEKYPQFQKWLPVLDTPKKDDLADCFLQGMWYIFKSTNGERETNK